MVGPAGQAQSRLRLTQAGRGHAAAGPGEAREPEPGTGTRFRMAGHTRGPPAAGIASGGTPGGAVEAGSQQPPLSSNVTKIAAGNGGGRLVRGPGGAGGVGADVGAGAA